MFVYNARQILSYVRVWTLRRGRFIWVFVKGVCRHGNRHVRHNPRRLTRRHADKRECRNPQEDVNPSRRLPLSVHAYTRTHARTYILFDNHRIFLFSTFYPCRRSSVFENTFPKTPVLLDSIRPTGHVPYALEFG